MDGIETARDYTMSVEFHIKARDAYQMLADAHNEEIEKMTPKEVKYSEDAFNKLSWTEKEGTKGNYEQTTKEANQDSEIFRALRQVLQDHKGFWQNSTHKYWNHQGNPDIIDRRKK